MGLLFQIVVIAKMLLLRRVMHVMDEPILTTSFVMTDANGLFKMS